MKHISIQKALLALLAMTFYAKAAVTAPVGYVKLTFSAEADTPFSIPMNRPKLFAGKTDSISENVINLANSDLTFGEFNKGAVHKKFYILFTTGVLEGRSFDIVSNSANSITLEQDGDQDLESLITSATAKESFDIRPHWTLNTLFPDGANIPKTTDFGFPKGIVQFQRLPVENGTNIPFIDEYLYFDSSNDNLDGWYLPNNPQAGKQNDVVLSNQTFYLFRNNTEQIHSPSIIGDVPTTNFTNSLRSHVILTDNYKSISFPIATSLKDSNLVESGVFKKTTDLGLRDGDTVQAFTYPIVGFNPLATTEYVYFDSSNDDLDGWYFPNNPQAGKQDDLKLFQPGRGYIIRSALRAEQNKSYWVSPMKYDPFVEPTP